MKKLILISAIASYAFSADAMLLRATRAFKSLHSTATKRLNSRARVGTITAGTGLVAYGFWPFSRSKKQGEPQEIEGEDIPFSGELAYSMQFKTADIDITYSDNEKNSVTLPSSTIGKYPSKEHLGEAGNHNEWFSRGSKDEIIGSATIHRAGSSCLPTSLQMLVEPHSIPPSMNNKLIASKPSVSVFWGSWRHAKNIFSGYDRITATSFYEKETFRADPVNNPEHLRDPQGYEIFDGKNPPHVSVALPYWFRKNDDRSGEHVKCRFNKLYKDNKPGIRARCGTMTVSVVSATDEPLAYTINETSGTVVGM